MSDSLNDYDDELRELEEGTKQSSNNNNDDTRSEKEISNSILEKKARAEKFGVELELNEEEKMLQRKNRFMDHVRVDCVEYVE
jgi:hypothetical protein